MDRPTQQTIERARALLQRADEVYEILRAQRYPELRRDQALHEVTANRIRIEALSIAMIEVIEARQGG